MADRILEVFRRFDSDGDGSIDKSELTQVLLSLFSKHGEEGVCRLLNAADTNEDGKIQYEEWVKWLCESSGDDDLVKLQDEVRYCENWILGEYLVLTRAGLTKEIEIDSEDYGDCGKGQIVNVVEIVRREDLRRLRARIEEPPCWISLLNLETQKVFASPCKKLQPGDILEYVDKAHEIKSGDSKGKTLMPGMLGALLEIGKSGNLLIQFDSIKEWLDPHQIVVEAQSCSSRMAVVGDRVRRSTQQKVCAPNEAGISGAWLLEAHEVADVADVDKAGDVKLRNPNGDISAWLKAKFFAHSCAVTKPDVSITVHILSGESVTMAGIPACSRVAELRCQLEQQRPPAPGTSYKFVLPDGQFLEESRELAGIDRVTAIVDSNTWRVKWLASPNGGAVTRHGTRVVFTYEGGSARGTEPLPSSGIVRWSIEFDGMNGDGSMNVGVGTEYVSLTHKVPGIQEGSFVVAHAYALDSEDHKSHRRSACCEMDYASMSPYPTKDMENPFVLELEANMDEGTLSIKCNGKEWQPFPVFTSLPTDVILYPIVCLTYASSIVSA